MLAVNSAGGRYNDKFRRACCAESVMSCDWRDTIIIIVGNVSKERLRVERQTHTTLSGASLTIFVIWIPAGYFSFKLSRTQDKRNIDLHLTQTTISSAERGTCEDLFGKGLVGGVMISRSGRAKGDQSLTMHDVPY